MQGGEAFSVPLLGECHPPGLTLPGVLDLGDLYVGTTTSEQWVFSNTGADCTFRVLALLEAEAGDSAAQEEGNEPSSADFQAAVARLIRENVAPHWLLRDLRRLPAEVWHTAPGYDATECAKEQGFEVGPSLQTVLAGQEAALSVRFQTTATGPRRAVFYILYSNCTLDTIEARATAHRPALEVRSPLAQDGYNRDVLNLPDCAPGNSSRAILDLFNPTPVPLPLRFSLTAAPNATVPWPPPCPSPDENPAEPPPQMLATLSFDEIGLESTEATVPPHSTIHFPITFTAPARAPAFHRAGGLLHVVGMAGQGGSDQPHRALLLMGFVQPWQVRMEPLRWPPAHIPAHCTSRGAGSTAVCR
jgi:hypothetical protein